MEFIVSFAGVSKHYTASELRDWGASFGDSAKKELHDFIANAKDGDRERIGDQRIIAVNHDAMTGADPFSPATPGPPTDKMVNDILEYAKTHDMPVALNDKSDVLDFLAVETEKMQLWKNTTHQVGDYGYEPTIEGFPEIRHLSIKRLDKNPIHDWRELQNIKNAICGPEIEAVEVYPAESRLVDGANQYHLWCFPPDVKLPFGFMDRHVSETVIGESKQRPFESTRQNAES